MERYDRNIPYNSLPDLPSDIALSEKVHRLVTEAGRALGVLKGYSSAIPNPSILVSTLSLREAKASSAIENIFTTDDELYQALSWHEDFLKEGPSKEILHYREAVWKGYANLAEHKSFSIEDVVDIYRIVKESRDGIRPHQAEIVIRKRGSGNLTGDVVYTPPRGKGVVENKMAKLLDFMNGDAGRELDPLVKMAMAHYQFEAIHPFRDGNGRTGRILSQLMLIHNGLIDMPILYLSSYIISHKDEYYYALSSVTGTQSWEQWMTFMMECVKQTSIYTVTLVKSIQELIQNTRIHIAQVAPKFRLDIVDKIFEQPYIRPKVLLGDYVKSLNTAKKYLQQLESMGFLSHQKFGKEVIYLNPALLTLLSES